jgi:fatty acid desaturase
MRKRNSDHRMSDAQKADHIRSVVLKAGEDLRARHTWLRHQDTIGATIMAVSLLGMLISGWAYMQGWTPWWVCVPVTAIFASFNHELEHDLIHQMYFRSKPWANTLMLMLGWLARANTVNPLVRRKLHLHHHKSSGTESDLEERGITNGEPWGIRRLLGITDNLMGVVLRPFTMRRALHHYIKAHQPVTRSDYIKMAKEQSSAFFPLGSVYHLAFYTWLIWHVLDAALPVIGYAIDGPQWLTTLVSYLDVAAVVYMLPNVLRAFSIQFISSNMHYYGDVEPRNVMQQCQVLNPWWLMPLQLFCFNFGSTHAIHHFAVKEPFYVRQWNAGIAHKVMRQMGVRFNDLGTFGRANRFHTQAALNQVKTKAA